VWGLPQRRGRRQKPEPPGASSMRIFATSYRKGCRTKVTIPFSFLSRWIITHARNVIFAFHPQIAGEFLCDSMQEVTKVWRGIIVFFTIEWSLCALSTKNNPYLITKNLTDYTENPSYLQFKKVAEKYELFYSVNPSLNQITYGLRTKK
jgi:hypothetical protein